MSSRSDSRVTASPRIVRALGEEPRFRAGDPVRVLTRSPIGHYRVPMYLRGKHAIVERVLEPPLVDNEEEAYGRNAGQRYHYYHVVVAMTELWADYAGSPRDSLRIDVCENWLEEARP